MTLHLSTLTRFVAFALMLFLWANCSPYQRIQDGETAYERKQFHHAIPLLKKEYKKTKSRVTKGQLAFLLAESYRKTQRPEEAIPWYKQAYDYQFGVEALKKYAYSLKETEQYEKAIEAFKTLGFEIGSPYEYRREITACKVAADWKKEKKVEAVEITAVPFNTRYAEYAPVFYEDGAMIFTSDRPASDGDEEYAWTGFSFSDLFISRPDESVAQPFSVGINSPSHEGTVAFSPDYQEVFFSRCYNDDKKKDVYCVLMTSVWEGEKWSEPQVLPFVEDLVNYGHPAISDDGNLLYFSSNHPDGWGGYDIYVSERLADGWSDPKAMPRAINTPKDEKFPTIKKDTLYFASSGHTGMGGLDIYYAFPFENGRWSPAYNMKPPINSGYDDFGLVFDPGFQASEEILSEGYFTSSRPGGSGADDIYRFRQKPLPPSLDTPIVVEEIEFQFILRGFVLEKIFTQPGNPNSTLLGRKPLAGAAVDIQVGDEIEQVTVGEDGQFELILELDMDYRFFATKPGYLSASNAFSAKGLGKDPTNPVQVYEIEIVLDKIYKDREIVLEDIYYDFDKWFIRDDAQPTLNELAKMLEENPDINIQLNSHTDCRGASRYNEDLSQKRASAAVEYLISKGINPDRLSAFGYGEDKPAVDCACSSCTEQEHQTNRRTSFTIID